MHTRCLRRETQIRVGSLRTRPCGSIGGSGTRLSRIPSCVPCWHQRTHALCGFRRSLTGAPISVIVSNSCSWAVLYNRRCGDLSKTAKDYRPDFNVHHRRPALAFAREHIVHGHSTFPSMSLLHLASAAGHSVTEDGAPRVATVVDAGLAAPIKLTALSTYSTPHLECCVDIMGGGMEILSTAGERPARKHLSAMLASAAVMLLPMSIRCAVAS